MRHDPERDAPASEHETETGAGTTNQPLEGSKAEDASATIQKEVETFQIGRIQKGVTDIPEVREYADRIGARLRSMRKLVVEEERVGRNRTYRRDMAEIKFSREGEIEAESDEFAPTDEERAAISRVWGRYEWPEYRPFPWTGRDPPRCDPRAPSWSMADAANLAICWDAKRQHILCVEERRPRGDGGKDIWIWTYWADGEWRVAEPPEKLPLYGLDTIKDAVTIFIHEGPKAAKAVQKLIADDGENSWRSHPWGDELRGVLPGATAHVGWLGGANRPGATDWSALASAGVKRAYLVADNDGDGQAAIPRISKLLRDWPITVTAIRFDSRFPDGFDLADTFPEKLFQQSGKGHTDYVGPSFRDCLSPATWATRPGPTPPPRGRGRPPAPTFHLRREFAAEWWFEAGEGKGLFVNQLDRSRLYTEEGFNNIVRPLSDLSVTSDLFKRDAYAQHVKAIAYEPGDEEGAITVEGDRAINTWSSSRIRPVEGDCGPWLDLMEHLIPVEGDRFEVMRWCATLIARPKARMLYGLLLASHMQGVGKTTLCEIMRVLVGEKNTRAPSAKDIVESAFNSWIVRKRLVFVNEIYEGKSWSAYQKIKGFITDGTLEANEKMIRSYSIKNWAHFILCSNAEVPLRIEATDRRFLIPEVTEAKRPKELWRDFYKWLAAGGYAFIAGWAERFVAEHGAVEPGTDAPDTERKRAMVEDSQETEERLVRGIAAAAVEMAAKNGKQVILVESDILAWARSRAGRDVVKASAIRGWLRDEGLGVSKKRLKVRGQMTHVAGVLPLKEGSGWAVLQPYRKMPDDLERM